MRILRIQATKEHQRFQGLGFVAFFDQKTRGLWETEEASSLFPSQLWIHAGGSLPGGKTHQNYCPCELNGKWDAITSCDRVSFFDHYQPEHAWADTAVVPVLGCPAHNSGQEEADCDAELVASHNCASDPFR